MYMYIYIYIYIYIYDTNVYIHIYICMIVNVPHGVQAKAANERLEQIFQACERPKRV